MSEGVPFAHGRCFVPREAGFTPLSRRMKPDVRDNFQRQRYRPRCLYPPHLGTLPPASMSSPGKICLLGVIMALGIPAIAWVENSALFFVLVAAGLIGIVAVFWRHSREMRSNVER